MPIIRKQSIGLSVPIEMCFTVENSNIVFTYNVYHTKNYTERGHYYNMISICYKNVITALESSWLSTGSEKIGRQRSTLFITIRIHQVTPDCLMYRVFPLIL